MLIKRRNEDNMYLAASITALVIAISNDVWNTVVKLQTQVEEKFNTILSWKVIQTFRI
jgi:hypothetical protein